jgi:hypothetical protein
MEAVPFPVDGDLNAFFQGENIIRIKKRNGAVLLVFFPRGEEVLHAAPSDTHFFRARRARDCDFALREPSGAENWIGQFQ